MEKVSRKQDVDWSSVGIFACLVALFVFFSIFSKSFLSVNNMINILRQISITGICAVGMTTVILTSGIDLSVGSVIGFTAVFGAIIMTSGVPIILAVVIVLAIGLLAGAISATCITYLNIPPLITTLGFMTALRGAVYLISKGMPIYGVPVEFKFLGQGDVFGIPVSVLIMVVVFIFGFILLNKTVFGRSVYGIGGNQEATRLSGVNIKKVIYKVYMLEGFLAALAGLILMSKVNSGQPSAGDGYEMDIITAVVLGGVSVSGGEGKILKVIIGVIFMGVLANGMLMMNTIEYWQRVVKGLVLIIAVAIDIYSKKKRETV
jgi:ribose transport system permease protein/inositol transport system permease protein